MTEGSTLTITVHDSHYTSMGCTVSNGYREFKVSDGYKEDVIAVVFEYFGEARERSTIRNKTAAILDADSTELGGKQFATFFISNNLFAIPAERVVEALSASAILTMSMNGFEGRIGMLAVKHENEDKKFVWVFDLGYMIRGKASAITTSSQIIVVQNEDKSFGLLVDDLHGVPEFSDQHITDTPFAKSAQGTLVSQVIRANNGNVLIQVLDVGYICRTLKTGEMPSLQDEAMIKQAA